MCNEVGIKTYNYMAVRFFPGINDVFLAFDSQIQNVSGVCDTHAYCVLC